MTVIPLRAEDREPWERLARAYKTFYATPTTDAEYAAARQRLLAHDGVHGLGALLDDQLVGIAHFLFHPSLWARSNCYLQDLFTLPSARGRGVGRALIEAVGERARAEAPHATTGSPSRTTRRRASCTTSRKSTPASSAMTTSFVHPRLSRVPPVRMMRARRP